MIDYFSTSTRDFFRCATRLVVTIYDLLLASILGICGSDASVAYPFPFNAFVSYEVGRLLREHAGAGDDGVEAGATMAPFVGFELP